MYGYVWLCMAMYTYVCQKGHHLLWPIVFQTHVQHVAGAHRATANIGGVSAELDIWLQFRQSHDKRPNFDRPPRGEFDTRPAEKGGRGTTMTMFTGSVAKASEKTVRTCSSQSNQTRGDFDTRLAMAMYSYAWMGVAMYGYLWLCVAMYDYVWPCIAMYGYV